MRIIIHQKSVAYDFQVQKTEPLTIY